MEGLAQTQKNAVELPNSVKYARVPKKAVSGQGITQSSE